MSEDIDHVSRLATSIDAPSDAPTTICGSERVFQNLHELTQSIEVYTTIPCGTRVGSRYSIQRLLGQGGLSRTYLAVDTHRFDELCVLKEFAPSGTGEFYLQKARDLFEREAKLLHSLCHPQIPKFLACFQEKGRLFLVQDFVSGKTYSTLLQERQQRGGAFSEAEIIQWLFHLLPVLAYIHACGIFHRDISPDNIMLPEGEQLPVLIDFGVGKQIILPAPSEATDENPDWASESFVGKMTFVGKLGYSPREQIAMGRCSPNSDLYSLGVAAIVLLMAKDPTLLVDRGSLEWQWQASTNVSDGLARILNVMLSEQPRHRFQSADEVLSALRSLVGVGAAETLVNPDTPVTHLVPPPSTATFEYPPVPSETTVSLPSPTSPSLLRNWPAPPIERAFIECCRHELARAIGPMAEIVLEDVLSCQSPTSPQELVDCLAAEIPDYDLAQQFRQHL